MTPTAPRGTGPGIGHPDLVGPTASRPTPSARAALAPLVPLFVLDVLTAFTVGMLPPLLPRVTATS